MPATITNPTISTDEKIARGTSLPLMEMFYTLQGEGAYTGTPAFFIRLAGCDVGCVWCDVKESWDADLHPVRTISDIVDQAKESGAPIAVITGGEPAMYNLDPLTRALNEEGIRTHVETSGAHELSGQWHWICFSPKKFKSPVASIYEQAHEMKVVVFHHSDMEWARAHSYKLNPGCDLYLQPEWSKRDKNTPLIIDFIKKHPNWKLSLQTHKYIDIP